MHNYYLAVSLEIRISLEETCSYKKTLLVPPMYFFFFIYVGCPGQLTRTTTIPHSPLDILQAQEQVRHRGGDRRAHRGSNPERGRNKSHG